MDSNLNKSNLSQVPNWINNSRSNPLTEKWISKVNPHNGEAISQFADSNAEDVQKAVAAALKAFTVWSNMTPVARGQQLFKIRDLMLQRSAELAQCVAIETGKPPQDAEGEVRAAISQAEFFASEGMRLYARSLTSGMADKFSHTIRQPLGVAALIVPANTPIANIAWKVFPALICGNTVVLKASEDSPALALLFAEITRDAGLPDGVFNVIQGIGTIAGASLVENSNVNVISFTGSTAVGKIIAKVAASRLARVSLELGGKNPFVVCDDADLDLAAHWACLSAFSNAGQRCAAGSRLIVFEKVYDSFMDKLVEKTRKLKLGVERGCDLGPVINERQLNCIIAAVDRAQSHGGKVLTGGIRETSQGLAKGFYVQPTIIADLSRDAELNKAEVFGPVVSVQKVQSLQEALEISNNTEYGLTSAIHTRNVDRAMWFAQKVRAGVANINLGTFGSEPHMPFGGFGSSGNGTREPGVEALDVYSELKNISFLNRPTLI